MKRANSEINVFSMSIIDLFCSAMGAFMIIAIILMPSFAKKSDAELQKIAEQAQQKSKIMEQMLSQAQQKNQVLEQNLKESQEKVSELKQKLDKTFLIVVASWETNDDIDMYMYDPDMHKFCYYQRRFDGVNASLAEDSKKAGTEIWETSVAKPGTYELFFVAFKKRVSEATRVRVRIYTKNGKMEQSDAIVNSATRYSHTYFIVVDEKGNVSVRVEDKKRQLNKADPKS